MGGFDVKFEKASTGLRKADSRVAADSWTMSRLKAILGEDVTLMQAVNFLGGTAPAQGLLSWQGHAGPSYSLALVAALVVGAGVAAVACDAYKRRAEETGGKSLYS